MFTDFSTSSDSSVDKRLTAPEFWTYNPLTSKEVGLGRPVVRRNSRAHSLVSGFFYIPSCAGHGSQFWRAVRDTRKGVPVLARSTNLHGLPPSLGRGGGRFQTLPGATMAKISPSQRIKPGDLAIFIGGLNAGKLVHVERAFTGEEVIGGTRFVKSGDHPRAWVVRSLGAPLISRHLDNEIDPKRHQVAPFNEDCLRPLRPGRGKDQTLRWTTKPTPKAVTQGAPA